MRIISGALRGIRLTAPDNLPVRPTTDTAKEALFNMLNNRWDFESISCLDLFSGTGNISFELASRGCPQVVSVDKFGDCVRYIKEVCKKYNLSSIKTQKADVFQYLELEDKQYDFIFADPPYDMPNLDRLCKIIFERNLLKQGGLLVIEHASFVALTHSNFAFSRKYGQSTFSFFEH